MADLTAATSDAVVLVAGRPRVPGRRGRHPPHRHGDDRGDRRRAAVLVVTCDDRGDCALASYPTDGGSPQEVVDSGGDPRAMGYQGLSAPDGRSPLIAESDSFGSALATAALRQLGSPGALPGRPADRRWAGSRRSFRVTSASCVFDGQYLQHVYLRRGRVALRQRADRPGSRDRGCLRRHPLGRCTLPLGVRGSSRTNVRAFGAGVGGQPSLGVVARGRPGTAAPTDRAARRWRRPAGPTRRPARPTTAPRPRRGGLRSTRSTATGHTFSPPVMIRSPMRPWTGQPPSSNEPASPVGNQPVGVLGVGAVAVGAQEHRAPHVDLAVGADPDLHAVERDARRRRSRCRSRSCRRWRPRWPAGRRGGAWPPTRIVRNAVGSMRASAVGTSDVSVQPSAAAATDGGGVEPRRARCTGYR